MMKLERRTTHDDDDEGTKRSPSCSPTTAASNAPSAISRPRRSERVVSYGELYERALGILFHLQKLGARPGDKLIIYLANNEQFLDAFWAGMLGGIVPGARGARHQRRAQAQAAAHREEAGHAVHLHRPQDARSHRRVRGRRRRTGDVRRAQLARLLRRAGRRHLEAPARCTTSNPTTRRSSSSPPARPANRRASCSRTATSSRTRAARVTRRAGTRTTSNLTWMPLTHDMGLIGMHIMMFAHRMQLNVMPTELFIRRPLLWMTFAARKGVTVTSSPNFGYRHYLKVLGDRELGDLDLSVAAAHLQRRRADLRRARRRIHDAARAREAAAQAMYPVYGLAEATLVVSFPQPPGEMYEYISVNRHELNVGKQPAPAADRNIADALSIMAVGQPIPYSKVRIADDDGPGAAREPHRPHPHRGRQRHEGLLRESGGQRQGLHRPGFQRQSLAAHRRSRNDERRQAVHHGPREGNHLRQRPELLPARHRKHRDPRRRPRARQGGGGRRAAEGREHRRPDHLRAASHGHEGVHAHRARRSRASSTNTRASKSRTWCR